MHLHRNRPVHQNTAPSKGAVRRQWTIRIPVFTLLILFFVLAGFPAEALDQNIAVTNYTVTPAVLMPGERGIVSVTLSNTGTYETTSPLPPESVTGLSSLSIESVFLDGKKDISVLGGNGQFEGQVGPGQSIVISFLIQAPPANGLYFTELLVRIRSHESIRYPVAINVNTPITETRQPALILSQSTSGPIRPGDSLPVQLTLENHGVSQAKDITVRVKETGSSVATESTRAFHIDRLNDGDRAGGGIVLTTDKDAAAGIHQIPVEISYTSPDSGDTTLSEMISLSVRGQADLSINALETMPTRITENSPFDMIIRLENAGTGNAESVRAIIDLPFKGGKNAFIGRIEPKSDAPAVFNLESGNAGEYPYSLIISYKDDWGDHEVSQNLTMFIQKPPDGTLMVVLVILLLLGGYAGWRLWTRRGAS